ncbi:MAG: hypothetical protein WBA99_03930 [Nodosilinea sp.]
MPSTLFPYGVVQSLNVQTAAALAIHAYIGQWGMVESPFARAPLE